MYLFINKFALLVFQVNINSGSGYKKIENICMEDRSTADIFQKMIISFPPNSHRQPVNLSQSDFFVAFFDIFVHWTAYFIACVSVTVSLLICMAVVLFSCVCFIELVVQCVNELILFVRGEQQIKTSESIF